MEPHVIEFYLYCDWAEITPTYRLYFDDTLLTERTYIWNNDRHVIQERLTVVTDSNPHTVTIEQVGQQSGKFHVETVKSDLDINVNIA